MAKVLLIEDDAVLSNVLRQSLLARLHEVDHVADGKTGLYWLENEHYAAAIIDWELPHLSGVEICRQYREKGGATPILMLTARGATRDKVAGLDAGADDYLAKPFELEELHARLRAMMRRKGKSEFESDRIVVGDLEIDTVNREVHIQGHRIQITRKEFGILELLARHANTTLSAETIVQRAWPSDSDTSPEVVRTHIARLRNKLRSQSEGAGELIKVIYGVGYKFETSL